MRTTDILFSLDGSSSLSPATQRRRVEKLRRLVLLEVALTEVRQLERASWDVHLRRLAQEFLGSPVLDAAKASRDGGSLSDPIVWDDA